jgi:hypothetical protein
MNNKVVPRFPECGNPGRWRQSWRALENHWFVFAHLKNFREPGVEKKFDFFEKKP